MIPWWKLLEGSPTQPTDVVNRGTLAPVVEYGDGSHALGLPGLITEPVEAWQRLMNGGASENIERMQRGLPYDPQAMGDALAVTGAAALSSLPAPRPSGAFVASGAPKGPRPGPRAISPEADLGAALQGERNGIRAYHGSPHDFDQFDISKMGTGEGAQAYGPGLYFAEAEDVARSYRDQLSDYDWTNPREAARALLHQSDGSRSSAADAAAKLSQNEFGNLRRSEITALQDAETILRGADDVVPMESPGHMYEVNINANPEDFLDWDAPLSGQSEAVKSMMGDVISNPGRGAGYIADYEKFPLTGQDLVNALSAREGGKEAARRALSDAGIPGARYLDQGSRTAGEGSRNYVVFDDKLINIVRKYGIAGAASLYGVSEADINGALMGGELMRDQ